VGIRGMSRLMERIMAHVDLTADDPVVKTRTELQRIAPLCHWRDGTWPELNTPWNELQNTPRHISALSNFLVRNYVAARTSGR
jgi:hypothetical protein